MYIVATYFWTKEEKAKYLYLYECDPEKNTECSKEVCHIHGRFNCKLTHLEEYAKNSGGKWTHKEIREMSVKELDEKYAEELAAKAVSNENNL